MLSFLLCLTLATITAAQIQGPITSDFLDFLSGVEEGGRLERPDLGRFGSFGGKLDATQQLAHDPVVFVHGNSDLALKRDQFSRYQTGWDAVTEYFTSHGYTAAELYATTWGDANSNTATQKAHTCAHVIPVRILLDAVIAYSGANKIDVIGHSMGVTIARLAIRGGHYTDSQGETCELGAPLNHRIDTFVGLAGANYGLCNCQYTVSLVTCNPQDGFFPGSSCGSNTFCGSASSTCEQQGYSELFERMNTDGFKEADHVYSFYSNADEILGRNSLTWGQPTARLPHQDGQKVYPSHTHMDVKDATAADQMRAIVNHEV